MPVENRQKQRLSLKGSVEEMGRAGAVAVAVEFLTVSFQSVKTALANPVKSLRSE